MTEPIPGVERGIDVDRGGGHATPALGCSRPEVLFRFVATEPRHRALSDAASPYRSVALESASRDLPASGGTHARLCLRSLIGSGRMGERRPLPGPASRQSNRW